MMKLRKPSLILHRYVGILAGLIIAIIGITGSLLVFEEELDRTLQPYQITPQAQILPQQTLIDTAQKVRPDLRVHRITMPSSPDRPYTVMMADPNDKFTDVLLDPYNGKVLGSKPWKQTLGGWLIDLHVHLFSSDLGEQIVGIAGVSLLVIGITGIVLWTGWRKLKIGFQIRWRSRWQMLNYDLHNVGGILSALLLSLIAFTGATMIYGTPIETGLRWLTQIPPSPKVTSTILPTKPSMSADAILNIAQERFPNTELYKFFPPKQPDGTFRVWLRFPTESEFTQDLNLEFDRYTGKLLKQDDARQHNIVDRLLQAQYTLHVGHYGGIVTKIVYALAGIAPLGLFATGIIIWWSRTYAAKSRRKSRLS
jgi:uncharacterized iron-regulated membrane protein